MSFLESLVGNAALTGEGIINSKIAQQNAIDQENNRSANSLSVQTAMAKMNQDLEIAKAKTLNDLKNKPLNDYATAVASHQNDTVDAEPPAPVKQTTGIVNRGLMNGVDGQPIQSAGPGDVGLKGNISGLRQQLMSQPSIAQDPKNGISDEDRAGALAQLDAQASQENAANAANAPTTRKVTTAEAADLGLQDTLTAGNGAAYAAGVGMKNSDARVQYLQDKLQNAAQIAADRNASYQDRTEAQKYIGELKAQIAELKIGGANGGKDPAMVASWKFLSNKGWNDDQISDYLGQSKHKSVQDIATNLVSTGMLRPPKGMDIGDYAVQVAQGIKDASKKLDDKSPAKSPNVRTFNPKTGGFD